METTKLEIFKLQHPDIVNLTDDEVIDKVYSDYGKAYGDISHTRQKLLERVNVDEVNGYKFASQQTLTKSRMDDEQNLLKFEQMKSKGQIGILEHISSIDWLEKIPFYGDYAETNNKDTVINAARKIARGEEPTMDELKTYNDYTKEIKELRLRGSHGFNDIVNGIIGTTKLGVETAAATMALGAMGISTGGMGIIAGGAAIAAAKAPVLFYAKYKLRELDQQLYITDKDDVFFRELEEKPFTTFIKTA